MAERGSSHQFEALMESARKAVEGIVRKKLRVTLSRADGRADNEDALELCREVELEMWRRYSKSADKPDAEAIRDFRGYAAVVAYKTCFDYLRDKYPEWYSLKNKLRYFMENRAGFAVWEADDREWLCGLASWQARVKKAASGKGLEDLRADPQAVGGGWVAGKHYRRMNADDWANLLDALFDYLNGPVELDDLVNIIADLLGVKDERELIGARQDEEGDAGRAFELPAPGLLPDKMFEIRELLERLWAAICQLRPNQRRAYLLNCTDADGSLEVFPWNGVAAIGDIGRSLDLSDPQFEILWVELPLDEAARQGVLALTNYDEKFIVVWIHLPLLDAAIAKMLGGTQSQVAGLRRLAREALAKRLQSLTHRITEKNAPRKI